MSPTPNDDTPFDGVAAVDGIVFASTDDDPELRAGLAAAHIPLPEHRPAPVRPRTIIPSGEWNPGGDIDPSAYQPTYHRPSPVGPLLKVMLPLIVLAGVVYWVMGLYGMR